ncbi:zinc finger and SCAN domain-containing protein 12-like [Ischnura elegans]|uniref:zinc finger and SCAN domain-containing protein 12-like n=1 Tax=Ischnura elegans TaxID=197161 RepID=UPI001ED894E0|nr:zinc finger and SCAN domain-containing protein 12-like [Ischnura elegans]
MNQCKSPLHSKTDNVVVHLGRLPEWICEQKTVKVLIKSQECVITSRPSSITWKEYRFMNSFCGKNLLPSQNQDLVNGQRLTHSTGGNVTVNFMAKLPDDINYCCKVIGACINPFFGFDLCHHAIHLLNNEAFLCLRKVQENMDFVLSMAITEAQCSDVECKECILLMDAPWLAASNPGGSLSVKEEGTGDDNIRSSTDSQDCLQSANEGTSQLPCAFQTTEIYIPVSDCLETRPDALFPVKEESEDPLSEGKYPVMNTPDPPEISRDVADPLATDELPLASTLSQEEWLECMAESTGAIVTDFEWKLIKEEPSPEEKDAAKEEEYVEELGAEEGPFDGTVGEEESYGEHYEGCYEEMMEEDTVEEGQLEEVMDVRAAPADGSTEAITLPPFLENGELMENFTMAHVNTMVALGLPAPHRVPQQTTSTSSLLKEGKVRIDSSDDSNASHAEEVRNVIDNDLEKYGTLHAEYHMPNKDDTNNELIEHLNNHLDTSTSYIDEESSMGKDECVKTLASSGENISSSEPAASKAFKGLERKRQGGNTLPKKFSEGKGEKDSKSSSRTRKRRNRTSLSTRERHYTCSVCDKVFTDGSNLSKHMRIHSGEKPYSCNICGKAFAVSGNLSGHLRSHTGEKPYVCSICHKRFSQSNDLVKHMRIHSGNKPYSCSYCCKSFTRSCHLTIHMRTHTGERPYLCSICRKGFTQSSDLTKHMRKHT